MKRILAPMLFVALTVGAEEKPLPAVEPKLPKYDLADVRELTQAQQNELLFLQSALDVALLNLQSFQKRVFREAGIPQDRSCTPTVVAPCFKGEIDGKFLLIKVRREK